MSVSIFDLVSAYGANGIWAFLASLFVVEFAPIVKWKPLTTIGKAIGKVLTSDLADKMAEHKADSCRYRIIRFDDEIRHHIDHTYEHFNQIIEDIDFYEDYCATHPKYPNSKAVNAIAKIKETFEYCKNNNSFL